MLAVFRRTLLACVCVFGACATPLRAEEGDEPLALGNPSGATADKTRPDNYLVKKRQYALSYNSAHGTPNWVAWQLSRKWLGRARRTNPFAPDTTLPDGFFVVRPTDYRAGGFDRGFEAKGPALTGRLQARLMVTGRP
jgi:endonuclease G